MSAASRAAFSTISCCALRLSSASLSLATVDRLAGRKIVLLVQLAEQAAGDELRPRFEQLQTLGLQIALYRQPRHRAFGELVATADCGAIDIGGNTPESIRELSDQLNNLDESMNGLYRQREKAPAPKKGFFDRVRTAFRSLRRMKWQKKTEQ